MSRLEELIAERDQLKAAYDYAAECLADAEKALLEERFRDTPRYQVGDIILVRRNIFGTIRPWPARVISVNLHYSSGHYPETYESDPGGFHESKTVSYSVNLWRKDGTFSSESTGWWHSETAGLAPEGATTP